MLRIYRAHAVRKDVGMKLLDEGWENGQATLKKTAAGRHLRRSVFDLSFFDQ
jgi:hypothetical protein